MNPRPYLEIVEQPKQRGMRFRYECEGRSAGSIPGENSDGERKTWPSCQIRNYQGIAVMRVSLVSKDDSPRPHPHSLVGRDCSNGYCQINVDSKSQMLGVFPNLGIQCVRRKEVIKAIKDRILNHINPFGTAIDGDECAAVDVDLNIVRLCFEAFLPDKNGNYTVRLDPVVSNPIYDKKATSSSVLKICRVDKAHGRCSGNEEVFLLCDKVQKEDIEVVFFTDQWEACGEFSPVDVHRQVAIVFKTPPYRDVHIQQHVRVQFKLRRPSDKETSQPVDFVYIPNSHETTIWNKQAWPAAFASKRPYPSDKKELIGDRIRSRVAVAQEQHYPSTSGQMAPFAMAPRPYHPGGGGGGGHMPTFPPRKPPSVHPRYPPSPFVPQPTVIRHEIFPPRNHHPSVNVKQEPPAFSPAPGPLEPGRWTRWPMPAVHKPAHCDANVQESAQYSALNMEPKPTADGALEGADIDMPNLGSLSEILGVDGSKVDSLPSITLESADYQLLNGPFAQSSAAKIDAGGGGEGATLEDYADDIGDMLQKCSMDEPPPPPQSEFRMSVSEQQHPGMMMPAPGPQQPTGPILFPDPQPADNRGMPWMTQPGTDYSNVFYHPHYMPQQQQQQGHMTSPSGFQSDFHMNNNSNNNGVAQFEDSGENFLENLVESAAAPSERGGRLN